MCGGCCWYYGGGGGVFMDIMAIFSLNYASICDSLSFASLDSSANFVTDSVCEYPSVRHSAACMAAT